MQAHITFARNRHTERPMTKNFNFHQFTSRITSYNVCYTKLLRSDITYTISGKKMEAPIKKILLGMPIKKSINFDAMRNPESVKYFIDFAKSLLE